MQKILLDPASVVDKSRSDAYYVQSSDSVQSMSLVDWYAAFWYMAKQWLWYSATILSPKLSLGIDIICVIILLIILRPIL